MMSMMRARFEVVAAAGKVVTISSTQQPKKPLQVIRVDGGGLGSLSHYDNIELCQSGT
jgi:hypothetical protein